FTSAPSSSAASEALITSQALGASEDFQPVADGGLAGVTTRSGSGGGGALSILTMGSAALGAGSGSSLQAAAPNRMATARASLVTGWKRGCMCSSWCAVAVVGGLLALEFYQRSAGDS